MGIIRPRIVAVVTPCLRGDGEVRDRNVSYAQAASADAISLGEVPLSVELFYSNVGSSPTDPSTRAMMIEARQELTETAAEAVVVYSDLGLDDGMRSQISDAIVADKSVEYRTLSGWS